MQPQEQPNGKGMQDSFNLFYVAIRAHATCFTVFLRRDFGEEALGIYGVGAFLLILLCAGADQSQAMMVYFWAWLAALIVQRCITLRLVRQGRPNHSQYDGWSWLVRKLPWVRDETRAKVAESLLSLIVGILLCPVSETVGGFVLLGSFSLLGTEAITQHVLKVKLRRMHDAEIEMREMARLHREAQRLRGPWNPN